MDLTFIQASFALDSFNLTLLPLRVEPSGRIERTGPASLQDRSEVRLFQGIHMWITWHPRTLDLGLKDFMREVAESLRTSRSSRTPLL